MCHPVFPSKPPLKLEVHSRLPFSKIWLEVQPTLHPSRKGGGAHYDLAAQSSKTERLNPLSVIILVCLGNT